MKIINLLRELSLALTDSQLGYAEAAERICDTQLKRTLLNIGNSRAPMIEAIANELAMLGEATPEDGTIKGTIHRAWAGFRDMVSGKNDQAVLTECEHAEQKLIEQYNKGIRGTDIPNALKDMFVGHVKMIERDLHFIMKLEKSIHL